jgi:RNA polymerase sigma-70 factor (ECF subfamily)
MTRDRKPNHIALVPNRAALRALTDEALVRACGVGDRAALAVLYERHVRDVVAFVGRMLGGADVELEDLVHATFVAVAGAAARFSGESSVRTWILGIAANQCRGSLRDRVRKRRALVALAEAPPLEPRRPDDLAEERELLQRLPAALAELDVDRRAAFMLCEVEGVSGVEAARILGCRPGTLWRRLFEARARLRALLEMKR